MTDSKRVNIRDLQRVAELAHLELTEAEEFSMLLDLNSILDHVDQLNELDTASVAAMAQVSDILQQDPVFLNSLREDEITPSIATGLVMRSAPDSDGAFFRVPKVIER